MVETETASCWVLGVCWLISVFLVQMTFLDCVLYCAFCELISKLFCFLFCTWWHLSWTPWTGHLSTLLSGNAKCLEIRRCCRLQICLEMSTKCHPRGSWGGYLMTCLTAIVWHVTTFAEETQSLSTERTRTILTSSVPTRTNDAKVLCSVRIVLEFTEPPMSYIMF
jgi:hypothetical protein